MCRTARIVIMAAAAVLAAAGGSLADTVDVRASSRGETGRLSLTWPKPVDFAARSADGHFTIRFERPAEGDFSAAVTILRRFLGAPDITDGGRALAFPLKPGVTALTFAEKRRVVVDLFSGIASADEALTPGETEPAVQGVEVATTTMRPVPAPNRVPKAKRLAGGRDPQTAAADTTAGRSNRADTSLPAATADTPMNELRFAWSEPVAAAVFRRAGALWIAFDRSSVQDLDALRAAAGTGLAAIEQRPHPRATVLRLETKGDYSPKVRRDGLAWIVGFAASPSAAVAIEPALNIEPAAPASLILPVAEPGVPLAITDPAVGDPLVIVPVVPLGHGVARNYTYPQLRLLASAQGIVISPLVDDLRVRSSREQVSLTTPSGFSATPVAEATLARARLGSAGTTIDRVLDLEPWADGPVTFTPDRQRLEKAVVAAKNGAAREQALLRLASFNLSHGFAAETLGTLAQAVFARPELQAEAPFRALRGAALLMMGRFDEAAPDLDHGSLAASIEAAAWRTALAVARGDGLETMLPDPAKDPAKGTTDLAEQVALVATYPRPLRKALLGPLAQAAIEGGSPALATRLVGLLAAEAQTPAEKAEASFLEGRRLAANGDIPGALAKWREVEADARADRRSRVRAVEARVKLGLSEQTMTPADAIVELERLDFVWRGDRLELDVLRQLGELYLGEGRFLEALRTLRRVATVYPDGPGAADVAGKLSLAFEAVLVGEKAQTLSPLSAVAIYDEFRELTPIGPRGDALIAAVADKMIELDLLGRATALLDSQVRYRLSGVERARTGARLAELYLLDDRPDAALQALEISAEADMPKSLAIARRYVQARALARLGRAEDALKPLAGLETPQAAAIRADIFWSMDDWTRAASSIADVLEHDSARGKAQGDEAEVPAEVADDTLHLAVAMALAGDDAGLRRLDTAYSGAMAHSGWRDVFPLIVANSMPTANLQALARDIGPVDSFRDYLARRSM